MLDVTLYAAPRKQSEGEDGADRAKDAHGLDEGGAGRYRRTGGNEQRADSRRREPQHEQAGQPRPRCRALLARPAAGLDRPVGKLAREQEARPRRSRRAASRSPSTSTRATP